MFFTNTQKEILDLYFREKLTIGEIAQRRNTTKRAIYRILQRIQETAKSNPPIKESGALATPYLNPPTHLIRLHSQQFQARLYNVGPRYKKGVTFHILGNIVTTAKKSISVFSGVGFLGDTPEAAYSKSWAYWLIFFDKLGRALDCQIIKPNVKPMIKEVKSHYAELNNEISTQAYIENERIALKSVQDNKTWLIVDNSFNLKELETTHPETARADMQNVIKPFMDNIRAEPELLDFIIQSINRHTELIDNQISLNRDITRTMAQHSEILRDQRALNQTILTSIDGLTASIKDIVKKL